MMTAIKTITLNNVLLQENGILRDENGLLIARLVDSVKFDDIENSLKRKGMKTTKAAMEELAKSFDAILKSDMCYEEQLETLLQATRAKFSIERKKIAENKVRIKEVQQFYLALTMAEELKSYTKIFHNIAKKRLEELEFWNLNRKKGE